MKGLAEHQTGNKQLGYELARKGLKLDITSAYSYHVLGVIYRNDRAYHQAYKYLQMAMYHDPKNDRILRDLAQVQLHLRDYEGHMKSRKALWTAHPNFRPNWIGYALAAQLCGETEFAAHLIKLTQESSLTDPEMPLDRWEVQNHHSELLLYRNLILRDGGHYEEALVDLDAASARILDKILVKEIRAELQLRTGRLAEAKESYLALIEYNPDNIQHHYGLLLALGVPSLSLENVFSRNLDSTGRYKAPTGNSIAHFAAVLSPELRASITTLYAELHTKYPKSHVTQLIPLLHWLSGADFEKGFNAYARPNLVKGVPSLFNSVKTLYSLPENVAIIEKWLAACVVSLEKDSAFPGDAPRSQEPTTLFWVYYFMALHQSQLGEHAKALEFTEKAITHSPTVMDIYLVKALVLAQAGDDFGAAEMVEKARTMDLADRNLNTLSVEYWLKACQIAKADQNLAIFTKLDTSHYSNVFSMQVMWYETLAGGAYLQREDMAKALKCFNNTIEHFHEINEDQIDFYHYAVRNFTLSTFVRLMRTEDRLHSQEKYIAAAKGLVRSYLRLDDLQHSAPFCPASFTYCDYYSAAPGGKGEVEATAAGDNADKPKKAGGKKHETAAATTPLAPTAKPWNQKHDHDPAGEQLKATKLPLKRAAVYVENLLSYAWNDLEAHHLAIQYYLRTKQISLALRSLLHAIELGGATQPTTHLSTVQLAHVWATSQKSTSAKLNEYMDAKINSLLGGKTAEAFNDAYATSEKASNSFAARVAAASAFVILGKKDDKALALLKNLGQEKLYCVKSLLHANQLIATTWSSELASFKKAVNTSYPLVSYFSEPKPKVEQVFETTNAE